MQSTLIHTKRSARLNISATLQRTAIAISDMRGSFHTNDVLFALASQGITSISAEQVRALLCYDGSFYRGPGPARAPRTYHKLIKKDAGWYTWQKIAYNPDADETNGERVFTVLE